MTEGLLAAGLAPVGHEQLQLGMGEDVLLRQPLGQHHVRRLVVHLLRLPLPQDPLLQPAEDVHQGRAGLLGHVGGRQHRSKRHLAEKYW